MNRELASLLFYNETLYRSPQPPSTAAAAKAALTQENAVIAQNLTPPEKEFLLKVLGAVKLTENRVDLIVENVDIQEITGSPVVKKIVVFGGINGKPVGENTYRIIEKNHKKWLLADALKTIVDDQNGEKKRLWEALKELFLT